MVKAIPLTGALAAAFGQAHALLLFTDLDKRPPPVCETLRSTFGLTPAEARLAAELASGDAVEDAASRLGITKETARNHLKAIFQKTEVHRQSELVALLARLPKPVNGLGG
jgi:DNA-binding CsgD family transcriptional regulator